MQLGRHAIVGVSIPINKNTPIVTGTLHVKVRLICFVCPTRIYFITRLPQSPNAPSACEVCGSKFPPCELGEWLTYQRAEPEWTVNEWLTSAPEV